MNSLFPLLAAAPRIRFEWARLESFTQWWQTAGLVGLCLAVLAYVVWMYRRDSVELRPWISVLLTVLRLAAFVGLLLVYLQPQYRSERDVVQNSRVNVLVDTSISMGRNDSDAPSVQSGPSRSQQVIAALSQGALLRRLREKHDVVIQRFDQDLGRVATFARLPATGNAGETAATGTSNPSPDGATTNGAAEPAIAWETVLAARGGETRIGQALRQVIAEERAKPIAGIILITDGAQNAGIDPAVAIAAARDAQLPIFPIGIGSDQQVVNAQVVDLLAPARAYPGDDYSVTAFVQGQGLAGRSFPVELLSRLAADGNANVPWQTEGTQEITLEADGRPVAVKFEQTPGEVGRRTLAVRIVPPAVDRNPRDNQREVDIEIVDRKTRVLLIAGGPTREYTFLRNQLYRDQEITVDAWLQTGVEGISQDADEILDDFPATADELFAYDAIVAFDPDWQALDAAQVALLEQWVSQQAGGLVLIAGPVNMDSWVQSPQKQSPHMGVLRALYPVEFHRRFALLDDARFGSTEPWPIDFTREGLEAEFLWLTDTASGSLQAWSEFPGVYGFYGVKGPKKGATVYGYYSDPRTGEGANRPVQIAAQFYGAGRVLYLGSGEMWRLRSVDETYFEQFYTKVIRHVSQGRLLRGSTRGVLLLERDRFLLGQSVAVRAQLNNGQYQPLDLPRVNLEIYLPDGSVDSLVLEKLAETPGNYAGQFNVYQEGSYRLELAVPESKDERLVRRLQVKLPDLENENLRRNDPLLQEIADKSGGKYFVGFEAALGGPDQASLIELLPDRATILPITDAPDEAWQKRWLTWMLYVIVGLLCLEWTIRRLAKLA